LKNVLFITSRKEDIRELFYKTQSVWKVSSLTNNKDAPSFIESHSLDLVFLDLAMTGCYAPDLLRQLVSLPNHPPIVILSRESSFRFQAFALKTGASGYLPIPYMGPMLINSVERLFESNTLDTDAETAGDSADPSYQKDRDETKLAAVLRGKSRQMAAVRKSIIDYRTRVEPLIIYGETGTGKDLVASLVHRNSPVSTGPYNVMNVSCIPSSLAESTLFGTVQGSFTGACNSPGLFESSHQGTLFLDEIGELDTSLQPKFLRVLEDKTVMRVGSFKGKKVDFRLICATNRKLHEMVSEGRFRSDLFYRIDVLRVSIPPLREHPEDIPMLCAPVLAGYRKTLSLASLDKLHAHSWPGNVRELFFCLSRAACDSRTDVIYPDQILFSSRQ